MKKENNEIQENKTANDKKEIEEIDVISASEITTENLVRKKGRTNFIGMFMFAIMLLAIGGVAGSRIEHLTSNSNNETVIKCVGGREYSESNGLVRYETVGDSLIIHLTNDEKVVFKNKGMCTIEGE